jgi:nicotinamidase-related amidase
VIVDLQKALQAYPCIAQVASRAGALARAFRRRGLPVVLVKAAGGAPGRTEQPKRTGEPPPDFMDILPELDQQASDHVVIKHTWGAFTGTDLARRLRGQGVSQVVLAGVATSLGVESTARQAHEHGFNVALAVDAMADASPEAHSNSVLRIFPRLGESGSAQEIIDLLDRLDG